MTTTQSEPGAAPETGLWSRLPKGVRLDEPSFRSRHRIISAVLAVHVPALAAIGLARGVSGWLLWGQLAAIVVALVARLRSCAARSPAPARSASG